MLLHCLHHLSLAPPPRYSLHRHLHRYRLSHRNRNRHHPISWLVCCQTKPPSSPCLAPLFSDLIMATTSLLLLLPILLSLAEAQIFPGSGLTAPATDMLSGRFLNSLNTTQVALIISVGGLIILAIAAGLFLLSFFRPSSSSSSSSSYGYGGEYASPSNQKEYSYPGYRSLR